MKGDIQYYSYSGAQIFIVFIDDGNTNLAPIAGPNADMLFLPNMFFFKEN